METLQPTFEQFKLNRQLLNAIEEAGYEKPTEVQQETIPLALAGHDVLGIAQTGTGKTAAFVLPLLMKVKYAREGNPRALILAPTRELVLQIANVVTQLGKYTDIRSLSLIGGASVKTQVQAVKEGVEILISTPRRFMDVYLTGEMVVKQLEVMVLDEADKMMDMGFMPQIRSILEVIPRKRQNLLFSATFQERVERLSHEFLEFPMKVEVTPSATTAERVAQRLYSVPNFRAKINVLEHLIQQPEFEKTLVFARSRETAENIYKFLSRKVVGEENVKVIHANKGQNTRLNAMDAFRSGEVKILVATDVASRGIDVTAVTHVVNFDVPLIYEDYVHRIGRTGRANLTGEAITFMTMADEWHIRKIEEIIRMEIPRAEIPEGVEIPATPKEELINMLREIDNQKRKDNPEFKGAFHEKKKHSFSTQKGRPGSGGKGGATNKKRPSSQKSAGRSSSKPRGRK